MNLVAPLPQAERRQVLFLRKVVAELMGDLPSGFERIEGWHGAWNGAGVETIVVGGRERIDGAFLDLVPELRLMACIGAGFDGVDLDAARARGVQVVNAAGSNAGDVADLAVALTLSAVCGLPALHRMVVDGSWEGGAFAPLRRSLSDLTIGILGLGQIGLAVADRLRPFGCRLIWWGPRPRRDEPLPRVDGLAKAAPAP